MLQVLRASTKATPWSVATKEPTNNRTGCGLTQGSCASGSLTTPRPPAPKKQQTGRYPSRTQPEQSRLMADRGFKYIWVSPSV